MKKCSEVYEKCCPLCTLYSFFFKLSTCHFHFHDYFPSKETRLQLQAKILRRIHFVEQCWIQKSQFQETFNSKRQIYFHRKSIDDNLRFRRSFNSVEFEHADLSHRVNMKHIFVTHLKLGIFRHRFWYTFRPLMQFVYESL